MKYYTRTRKNKRKSVIAVSITIFIFFNLMVIVFDKKVMPSVLAISETLMRAEAVRAINEVSMDVFDEIVGSEDIVIIERDDKNRINLIKSNTQLINKVSGEIAIRCNEKLEQLGIKGIEAPLGWMTDKSIYYNLGPKITIQMEPLGNIETSYDSIFESAGINQTRHKIYLNVKARIKIIIPMYSKEMNVDAQIPLSESIIVGEIPDTAIELND